MEGRCRTGRQASAAASPKVWRHEHGKGKDTGRQGHPSAAGQHLQQVVCDFSPSPFSYGCNAAQHSTSATFLPILGLVKLNYYAKSTMSICATKKVKATARRGAHWSSTAGELDADADAEWGLEPHFSRTFSELLLRVSMRNDGFGVGVGCGFGGRGRGQTLSAKNCGAVYCKSSLQCKCCQSWLTGRQKGAARGRQDARTKGREPATPLSLLCLLSCLIIKCEKCLHTFRLSVTLMKSRRAVFSFQQLVVFRGPVFPHLRFLAVVALFASCHTAQLVHVALHFARFLGLGLAKVRGGGATDWDLVSYSEKRLSGSGRVKLVTKLLAKTSLTVRGRPKCKSRSGRTAAARSA
ncbi:GM23339 [Drosophila sechellia]|uniref:GM23339 n=1 Tax=Drosophila sechellia TaxID=7238 RepID=B4IFA4_DROSE|nr:GM23339 [Drosophila sechellia]